MFITSIGYYIPDGRITNSDITEILVEDNKEHFSKEDIEFLTYSCTRKFEFLGIETRSCCSEENGDHFASMAEKAARKAIDQAGIPPEEIDCLIFSGVTNPFREPSFAIMLAHRLGIKTGDFFDINDTCNGFMKSIDVAGLYLKSEKYRHILVATCESPYDLKNTLKLDIHIENTDQIDNRLSGLIVGTGAAAMILSSDGGKGRITHYGEQRTSNDWDASMLTLPGTAVPGAKYGDTITGFWSDGRLISSSLIREMPEFILRKLSEWGLDAQSIDLFIHHQLGNNVTFALMDKLNADHQKAPVNTFKQFGNMATVNIPVNLAIADEQGLIKKGDSILLLSSSCGLSYALLHIVW
ncbi:MAG: hypothetical protein KKD44_14065 [Proteobacteria bacterium]|nr:hypothetical protein [Pseudomonadota bacterium]